MGVEIGVVWGLSSREVQGACGIVSGYSGEFGLDI